MLNHNLIVKIVNLKKKILVGRFKFVLIYWKNGLMIILGSDKDNVKK